MAQRERMPQASLGALYAFLSYLLWGFLPGYFLLLAPSGPWEIVAWRVLLSLGVCALILTVTRHWARLVAIVRQRRLLLWTAVAGILIYGNWQIFVIGTVTERILETSLGYFITPILTVLLGVLVLGERLRATQWAAVGLATVAVIVLIVGYGTFPWIALGLAFSFGLYGLVKKRLGPSVDAVSGLTLETVWLVPVAVGQLVFVGLTTGITMGTAGAGHALLLGLAGFVTAVPLLLFAAGARRAPLSVVGLLQFLTPFMQFVLGAWIMGEPMPPERWIGFGLVWVALAVLSADAILAARRARRAGRAADAASDLEKAWTGGTSLPK